MISDFYIEIFGALTGVVYVALEIYKRPSMWIVGIVTSLVYIYVFAQNGFYAMAGLNIYYVGISVYGLWRWSVAPDICRIGKRTALLCLSTTALIFILLAFGLERYTNATMPYADALITSMSIVATWMLSRSYLEQWWVWIVANALAIGVYGWQGLYPTAILYMTYLAAAIVGLRRWRRVAMTKVNTLPNS
ncbi:MAG: nicotinamide riboside transporter PnuC [Bacteroidales bacterium]|nr:nicotinamide riboside transporter PnuC [Bacteroidales bacterium]